MQLNHVAPISINDAVIP
ncbi:hypothetical protein D047_2417A, partial [Vibrio parahaemolyticus VPTS-2010_2]